MTKSIGQYSDEYIKDYGFEAEMVHYRGRLIQERLAYHAPQTIIELGCGTELQAERYLASGGGWKSWTIVEPSKIFAEHARNLNLPGVAVVEGYFEQVASDLPEAPDMILCSGLLHEVPDADHLLAAIHGLCGPRTVVHINVPNARSLHRQLANSMGLINDLATLSPRNITLQQPRVFNQHSLAEIFAKHEFQLKDRGGHFVKPFTHAQMETIAGTLGREVLDGLYRLGQASPDLASEIYVEGLPE